MGDNSTARPVSPQHHSGGTVKNNPELFDAIDRFEP
jgi:hypothetical protein